MRSLFAAFVTLALLASAGAQAGIIHDSLQARLDQAAQDEFIGVIVNMAEQAPVAALNDDLKSMRASRQLRHEEVVRALQDMTPTQALTWAG